MFLSIGYKDIWFVGEDCWTSWEW